jgi:hypothetical protein
MQIASILAAFGLALLMGRSSPILGVHAPFFFDVVDHIVPVFAGFSLDTRAGASN